MQRLSTVEHGENEEWSGDTERHDPDDGDLDDGRALAGDVAVAQREVERQVAINRDHTQVTDGRRRKQHVQAVPREAQQLRDWQTC